jgi:hypothetical protein
VSGTSSRSETSSVSQLLQIDDLTRGDHWHLRPKDDCFFIREHISRGGYKASETNQLISNLKKEMDRKGLSDWPYKERAIYRASSELRTALGLTGWEGTVIVPMPPSKAPADPLYDDRMVQVASHVCAGTPGVVRELLYQTESRAAFHKKDDRRDVALLIQRFQLDERLCEPRPGFIMVLDDVLTTGAHFVAAKTVLQRRFGEIPVVGIFVARRVFPQQDPPDALAEAAAQAMLDERRSK